MSITPQSITVTADTQENYVIYDRTITKNPDPPFNDNILVTADNLSNRLYFNMWYTFDDRELEDKEIKIVWTNANNEKGMSLCVDKALSDNKLTFAWNVPIEATYKEGTIKFAVRITTDNYVWNSLIGTVEVRQGLVTEEFNDLEEAQSTPGWVDYIEGKYKMSLQSISEDDFDELDPKDNNTIYVVAMNDLSISLYQGSKPISTGGGGGGGGGGSANFQQLTVSQWQALTTKDPTTFYIVTDDILGPPNFTENVYSLFYGERLMCNTGLSANQDSSVYYKKTYNFGDNDASSIVITLRRAGRVVWYNISYTLAKKSDLTSISSIGSYPGIITDVPIIFCPNDGLTIFLPLTEAGYEQYPTTGGPCIVITSNPYELPKKVYVYNVAQVAEQYYRPGVQSWTGCYLSLRDNYTITSQ
jgi:hypothetical protein